MPGKAYIGKTYGGFDEQFKLIADTAAANTSGAQPVWTHIPAEERAEGCRFTPPGASCSGQLPGS
jgi:hypothetical protein